MAATIPKARREKLIAQAYKRSLEGATELTIAGELGVSERTVWSYLQRAREKQAKRLDADSDRATAEFINTTKAVMEDAWRRLHSIRDTAMTAPSLQKNVLEGAKNIATVQGVFIERRDMTSGGKTLQEIIQELMAQRGEVRFLEDEAVSGELDESGTVLPMRPGKETKSLAS